MVPQKKVQNKRQTNLIFQLVQANHVKDAAKIFPVLGKSKSKIKIHSNALAKFILWHNTFHF
jgi:hypothetical protein